MTDVNLLTIAEFTAEVPELDLSAYDNPTISGFISSASRMVSDYLQFTPVAEIIENEIREGIVDTNGDLVVFTEKLPILSVTTMSLTKGTTTVDLELQDGSGNNKYNIDYSKRHIRVAGGEMTYSSAPVLINFSYLRGSQFYTKTTYQAGWAYSELPKSIKEACKLFMRDIITKKFNVTGATRLSQGGVSFEFGGNQLLDTKSQFVKEAERLLNPYRRIA